MALSISPPPGLTSLSREGEDNYNIRHDMGIYADIEIGDSERVQHYGILDEAVERWKARREIPKENEHLLREYLAKNLESEEGDGLVFRRKTKSAMIWWPKAESS